jgi:hypothetical protein
MRPWEISLTHRCVCWGDAWEADVRQAFAAIGWIVTSMGPTGSSTHVEDDRLALASSSKEFDPAVLMDVLSQLGVHSVEYVEEDGNTCTFRNWAATLDEHWWDRYTDPRALVEAVRRSPPDGSHTFKNYENWNRKFLLCACAAGRFCKQAALQGKGGTGLRRSRALRRRQGQRRRVARGPRYSSGQRSRGCVAVRFSQLALPLPLQRHWRLSWLGFLAAHGVVRP